MGNSDRQANYVYEFVKWVVLPSIAMFVFVLLLIGLNNWGEHWGKSEKQKSEKQKLAEKYNVSEDAVFINRQPHGCDYDDAPLGNKHCHFERKEEVTRDDLGKPTAVYVG